MREGGREREDISGEIVRDITIGEGGQENIFLVFKVPRQGPLILFVEVMQMIGINFIYVTLEGLHYSES
jgi:hypothetical protein